MITNNEIEAVELSPTKKDYYQIWSELMEVSSKLATVFDPSTTNESDPIVVLLKEIVALADKINYNTDKNILEAFLPSATQEESVRKICEELGYTPKYYKSATTNVTISWLDSTDITMNNFKDTYIYFPKYVNIKDTDESVNYVTTESFTLSTSETSKTVSAIEGQLCECESNNDNIITATYLDDNNRFILPEENIAENGIFVVNISNESESDDWVKVDNLNSVTLGTKVYKIGYDSVQQAPYVQFPEDIDQLIEDGLRIRYIRTNGAAGNISSRVLSKIEVPSLWSTADTTNPITKVTSDNFKVNQLSATKNGKDKETINEAYNNFKRTVGTFETLVSCRDYANKIYEATVSSTDSTPLVSNINVTDIRDDLNRSSVLCSFNEYGISYTDVSQKSSSTSPDLINHFDLILYPFKTVYDLNTEDEFVNSFKFTTENSYDIEKSIRNSKSISHKICYPSATDTVLIKIMMKIKADITTTRRVSATEESAILKAIYAAIFKNFNMRKLEFGEKINEEELQRVIKNASTLIKDVGYSTIGYYTVFVDGANNEYLYAENATGWQDIYNNTVVRNILAGRLAAFTYVDDFVADFSHKKAGGYDLVYGTTGCTSELPPSGKKVLKEISTRFTPDIDKLPLVLKPNESIIFRAPNLKTTKTYPSYVNYYLKLNDVGESTAIPATFQYAFTFMNETEARIFIETKNNTGALVYTQLGDKQSKWESLCNFLAKESYYIVREIDKDATKSAELLKSTLDSYGVLFTFNSDSKLYEMYDGSKEVSETPYEEQYYYISVNNGLGNINAWLGSLCYVTTDTVPTEVTSDTAMNKFESHIYKATPSSTKSIGYFVDSSHYYYTEVEAVVCADNANPWTKYYVQKMYPKDADDGDLKDRHTSDGKGKDDSNSSAYIKANTEYELKQDECLYINYTDSSSDTAAVINEKIEEVVIRPNFDLYDSNIYSASHSYQKKSGFNFENSSVPGMFTLSSSQQIEIREQVKADLKGTINIYWTRNDDDENAENGQVEFEFDEDFGTGKKNAYTLKDGEYFYYTDSKKIDLVYYGAGTTVVNNGDVSLTRTYDSESSSIEEIISSGSVSAIDWSLCTLNNTKYLTMIENQYVTLTEGDSLTNIEFETGTSGYLSNSYVTITGASYKFNNSSTESTLPKMACSNFNWEARSRLNLNMSYDTNQFLFEGDEITLSLQDSGGQKVSEVLTGTGTDVTETSEALCINSNYICNTATDHLSTDYVHIDEDGNTIYNDMVIRVSTYSPPTIGSSSTTLQLDNYSGKYTKFAFKSIDNANNPAFNLNASIPDDCEFGLMMIYYIDKDVPAGKKAAYIKSDLVGIKNINNDDYGSEYTLKSGINIIQIDTAVSKLEVYSDAEKSSHIVFSHIRNVKDKNDKLAYNGTLNELISKIKNSGIAEDFYYSVDIDSDNVIDLDYSENLNSPGAWYNYNNINNNFVITEIDPDAMYAGIRLTSQSKIKR